MRVMSNFDFLRNDDEIDEGSYATAGGKEHLLPNIGILRHYYFVIFVSNEFFKIA